MSSGRSIKIVLFAGTAFVGLMAAILPAEAGSRFGGGMGGGGARGAPFQPGHPGSGFGGGPGNPGVPGGPGGPWGPGHPGSEFRRSTDAGVAGAVAGDSSGYTGYNPQPQPYPAPMPNCTDELQQERGAYSYRIGQRRVCY